MPSWAHTHTHTQRERIQANLHRFSKQMWDSENINTNESLLLLACRILGLNIIVEKCRVADVSCCFWCARVLALSLSLTNTHWQCTRKAYTAHTHRHWHTTANNPNQTGTPKREQNRAEQNKIVLYTLLNLKTINSNMLTSSFGSASTI